MSADGVFEDRIARTYDEDSADMFAPEVLGPTVDFLAELADGRRVLEFAIGTGRVALPLSARGVEVAGIELSRAMVAEMMAKPGAAGIPVTIGDMATTRAEGTFGLVYLVYRTSKSRASATLHVTSTLVATSLLRSLSQHCAACHPERA
jgi:SAM-dependent methyltransferase